MSHTQKAIGEVSTHNRESESVAGLIPFQLRSSASTLISFLEDYYKYLNSADQATDLINRIQHEHDIDLCNENYLKQLKKEIAKDIPNSDVLNNRQLFRRIIEFYKTRGSHDSIETFFRLFFDDEVSVKYLSEFLFKGSSGEIQSFGFEKQDGTKIYFDTVTKTYSEAIPTGPDISTPSYVPADTGYINVGSNFENVFWTYGKLSVDKSFTIRVTKARADLGIDSPLSSPQLSGYSISTKLNSGDNKVSTNLTNNNPTTVTIDTSEIIYDSPLTANTNKIGTYKTGGLIYNKDLNTGDITVFEDIQSPDEPHVKTVDLTDRHLYYGLNEELGIATNGRGHSLIPTKAGGKYFCDALVRNTGKETVYNFYAFEDGVISFYINTEQDFDSPVSYAPTLIEKKRVKANTFVTFITPEVWDLESPETQDIVFFSSTGHIAGTKYTTGGFADMTVLSPMAADYVSRGDNSSPLVTERILITYDIDNNALYLDGATTDIRHTISNNSPAITNGVYGVVHIDDGSGADTTQGIAVGSCNDTYLWPTTLTGYSIVSPYSDNEVKVYEWDDVNATWDLYETLAPTKDVTSHTGSYSGLTSPQNNYIGNNSPAGSLWKFEGTYPFALWINDELDDEELVWGWNRTNYNLPIYTQFSVYSDRKGHMSDIIKLHDGDRWQQFSYIINTGISIDRWKTAYYKLVHPIGLKLFSEINIEALGLRTDREVVPSFNIQNNNWVLDLYTTLNNHSPFYQPGWIDASGLITLEIIASAMNLSVDEIETDQVLLSTYTIEYDTVSTTGVLSITLRTTYVHTDTNYVLMDTAVSPQNFLGTALFETGNSNNLAAVTSDTHNYVTWNTPISSVINMSPETSISEWIRPLDVANVEDITAYLGSTTGVTEHQQLTVLEGTNRPDNAAVYFPSDNSPAETITEITLVSP